MKEITETRNNVISDALYQHTLDDLVVYIIQINLKIVYSENLFLKKGGITKKGVIKQTVLSFCKGENNYR